jgi:DNA-binding NarL/FixJ family response regulator
MASHPDPDRSAVLCTALTGASSAAILGSHAGALRRVICDGGVGYSVLMTGADGGARGGTLLGRDAELALIAARLADREVGAAILVRGPAGIGKTALIEEAVRRVGPSRRILRTVGNSPETGMAMAGLYQLLQPLLPLAHQIPEPRQAALRVAFGITVGAPPEPFALAMAALELLVDAAAEQPLLVVAEDMQWLDPATVGVLRFVSRRLEHDPVVLLATARDDEPDPLRGAASCVLDLEPLGTDDSRWLLASVAPDLSSAIQARVLRIAEGNPLALVELPKTPGLTPRAAGDREWLPLTQRLQAAFAARVERLPSAARTALILLALHDSESLAELLDALGEEGTPADLEVLEPAIAAGLVELSDGELRFRHGLMRSAVYHLASPSSRVAGHLALARAVGPGTDRGILHRARAATGYDEALAAELELVADRAVGRGAVSAAVTTLARAAELTTSAPDKRRYLFRAAVLAYELGQADVGDAHRAVLALLADDEHSRLLLQELGEIADAGAGGGVARIRALIGLAERSRRLGDERLTVSFLRSAAYRCWMREPGNAVARTIVRLVTDTADWLGAPQRAILLAYADPIGSYSAVTEIMHAVVTTDLDSVTIWTLGHAASCMGDLELADMFYTHAVARLRAEGRLQVLARAVVMQAWTRLRRGQWSTAMPLAEEGRRLAEESGQAEWQAAGFAGQAMVAALRGEVAEAAPAADRAERIAVPNRMTNVAAITLLARATAAAAEGDFSAAWDYLSRLHRKADPGSSPFQALWSLSHLAYAAVQCDRVDRTRELVQQLTSRLPPGPIVPTLRMNVIYADALLASDELIEQRIRAALDVDVGSWPFERSRMQLMLGSRLRRRKQTQEARELLRAARDGFDSLGARLWAGRAREELRAAGVPSREPAPTVWSSLSAQELQVARMVAEGLSNRQIGERLYLSHRTVASHLYRIFPKLGITSRAQLTVMSLDLPAMPPPQPVG